MLRAIVLIVALASGGVAAWLVGAMQSDGPASADLAAQQKPAAVSQVLVAAAPLEQGAQLGPDKLRWQTWPDGALQKSYILRSQRPKAIEEMSGRVVRSRLVAGAPVLPENVAPAKSSFLAAILSPGMRAVAIRVSADKTAGGFVLPNDRVDVLLAVPCRPQDGCQSGVTVRTILKNVRVLAIDQSGSGKSSDGALVGKTATLELSPKQAETIVGAQAAGTLSLVLRAAADHGKEAGAVQDKARTVRVLRGGVGDYVTVR